MYMQPTTMHFLPSSLSFLSPPTRNLFALFSMSESTQHGMVFICKFGNCTSLEITELWGEEISSLCCVPFLLFSFHAHWLVGCCTQKMYTWLNWLYLWITIILLLLILPKLVPYPSAYQFWNTSSHTITEVKKCWSRLGLGWETPV